VADGLPTRPPLRRSLSRGNPRRQTMTGYDAQSTQQIIDLTSDDDHESDVEHVAGRVVIDLTEKN